jgi:anti-sigma B factor antagonist
MPVLIGAAGGPLEDSPVGVKSLPTSDNGGKSRPVAGDEEDTDFVVVATHRPAGGLEVLVVGELDLATTPQLRATVLGELEQRPSDVAVVLNAVTFIDSTGLIGLIDLRDAVVATGRRFSLVSPSESARYVLDLTGLGDIFDIEE